MSCGPDLSSDLVGYWDFNDNLEDQTTNSNHGIGSGGINYVNGVCGSSNGALQFDGVNDLVDIPDHPAYAFGTDPFTVSFWMKTTQVPGIESVISMKNNGNNGDGIVTFLNLTGNGKVSGRVRGGEDASSSGPLLNDGDWHHIVYTRNGTAQRIFVDGALNNSASLRWWMPRLRILSIWD
ncbi:MAG: LamG domain-containing protein [Bacteroidota bacterium]|nr:LamG domain-containing protein [Bacteroidota bacterium]